MRSLRTFLLAILCSLLAGRVALAADPPLASVKRVVFLGDSITYSGQYLEFVEACLRTRYPELKCQFLDLGLPSETVSGLSEPNHAGGKFPRPDVHERLERVLSQTKPDLVVACYGMNCGIYYPFSEERFAKYQEGMRKLRKQAAAHGAKVLHVTPLVFDAEPIKARTLPEGKAEYPAPFVGYDGVLAKYSEWLLSEKANGWEVVDVHGPMSRHIAKMRESDPKFTLAGDGVHPNTTGHWIIAQPLLAHWGFGADELAKAAGPEAILAAHPKGAEVLKLVQQRQRLEKDAWLTATKHQRPGMKQGLPLEEAAKQAGEMEKKIQALLMEK